MKFGLIEPIQGTSKRRAVTSTTQHTSRFLNSTTLIDESLIDGTQSMFWADYRKGSKKANVHVGFDLNRSIGRKVHLTEGNGAERPFVSKILSKGQTRVVDLGYLCHELFDQWQQGWQLYICRIKANTNKKIISENPVPADNRVFLHAMVF